MWKISLITDRKSSPFKEVYKSIQSSQFIIHDNTLWSDMCQYLLTIYSDPLVTIQLYVSLISAGLIYVIKLCNYIWLPVSYWLLHLRLQLSPRLLDWLTFEISNIVFRYNKRYILILCCWDREITSK
jgi:hypothetical protein